MSRPAKAVETAHKALTAATELHTRWCTELDTARAELDALRQRAGGSVLDDPAGAEGLAQQLAELAGRVELAERAVAAAVERVGPLRRELLAARAQVHIDRADKIATTRTALQGKVDELLAELTRLQGGGRYVLDRGRPVSVGTLYDEGRQAPPADTDRLEAAEREERAAAAKLTALVESGNDAQVTAAILRPLVEPAQVARDLAGVR